jgi:hypothetical protein
MVMGLLILVTVLAVWIAPRTIATPSAVAATVAMYVIDSYEVGFSGWFPLAVCCCGGSRRRAPGSVSCTPPGSRR